MRGGRCLGAASWCEQHTSRGQRSWRCRLAWAAAGPVDRTARRSVDQRRELGASSRMRRAARRRPRAALAALSTPRGDTFDRV